MPNQVWHWRNVVLFLAADNGMSQTPTLSHLLTETLEALLLAPAEHITSRRQGLSFLGKSLLCFPVSLLACSVLHSHHKTSYSVSLIGPTPQLLRDLILYPQHQKTQHVSPSKHGYNPSPQSTGCRDPSIALFCNRKSRVPTWSQLHLSTPQHLKLGLPSQPASSASLSISPWWSDYLHQETSSSLTSSGLLTGVLGKFWLLLNSSRRAECREKRNPDGMDPPAAPNACCRVSSRPTTEPSHQSPREILPLQ